MVSVSTMMRRTKMSRLSLMRLLPSRKTLQNLLVKRGLTEKNQRMYKGSKKAVTSKKV